MALQKIALEDLTALQDLYKVQWPLHIITYNTIKIAIDRFQKQTDWCDDVNFWRLDRGHTRNGGFITIDTNLGCIFFNTLEPEPFAEMRTALSLIDYTDEMVFLNTREIFRNMLMIVISELPLRLVHESSHNCFFINKEVFETMHVK